jgi:adenylate cyclase
MVEANPLDTLPQAETMAIMFADLAGSSALYKQLGDATAKECIDHLLDTLVTLAQQYDGHLVKNIGDEIMLCFVHAEDAAVSAVKIQERAATLGFAMRIGLSCGPVVVDQKDVFGDTVNQAAFLTGIALARQIVLAQTTVDSLPAYLRSNCQQFDRMVIKGSSQETDVYRLNWRAEDEPLDATRVNQHPTTSVSAPKLVLEVDGEQREVTSKMPSFHLGRDARQVDLVIHAREASRDHCHILFHRGKYVLVDHSTNGTYVLTEGHPEAYIRRESTPLLGSGHISLGQPYCENSRCIAYRITTS